MKNTLTFLVLLLSCTFFTACTDKESIQPVKVDESVIDLIKIDNYEEALITAISDYKGDNVEEFLKEFFSEMVRNELGNREDIDEIVESLWNEFWYEVKEINK